MKRGRIVGQPLVELYAPLSDHDKAVIAQVYGPAPDHKPVTRQPYDSLYLKQKAARDYWK